MSSASSSQCWLLVTLVAQKVGPGLKSLSDNGGHPCSQLLGPLECLAEALADLHKHRRPLVTP